MMANTNAYCPGNGIGFEPGDFDAPLRPNTQVIITKGIYYNKTGHFLGCKEDGRAIVQIGPKRITLPENALKAVLPAKKKPKVKPDDGKIVEVKSDLPDFSLMATGRECKKMTNEEKH